MSTTAVSSMLLSSPLKPLSSFDELEIFYRIQTLTFGKEDGSIEVREFRYRECQTDSQRALFDKITFLYQGGITIAVQDLMTTVGFTDPVDVLEVLHQLQNLDLISGFKYPEI